MKILVTGGDGFIGRNLRQRLAERSDLDVVSLPSGDEIESLPDILAGVEFVVHLAGVNRPSDPAEFMTVNYGLTAALCGAVARAAGPAGRRIPILFASSLQVERNDGPYARSKRAAEQVLLEGTDKTGAPAFIFRLPNVFGKWCRPNYNSVIATFCYNAVRSIPLDIHDPEAPLTLVYIDDVVERFVQVIDGSRFAAGTGGFNVIEPQYRTTVGAVAAQILRFHESRRTLTTDRVGEGFLRALHSTYLSYLPAEDFAYSLEEHSDARGKFVEVLKTPDCGQFSYFTALPGITRGGHYHHTKTEKFLVLRGRARFRFRHVQDGRVYEQQTSGARPEIVETVPGWAHDITNIGDDELLVMLWANEVFDPARPDTFSHAI